MMLRSQFGDFILGVLPNMEEAFFSNYVDYPTEYTRYFTVKGTDLPFLNISGVGPFELPRARNEAAIVHIDEVHELGSKRFDMFSYGLGFEHSREAFDDEKHGVFTGLGAGLARAFRIGDEIIAADIFEQGHSSTAERYLTADDENFFDAAHPIEPGSSTTYSNYSSGASTDLDMTSLQSIFTAMQKIPDSRGNRIMIMAKELVVPLDLQFEAAVLAKSTEDPETADRSVTPLVDWSFTYSVWHWLTDTDAWYVTSDYAKQNITTRWYNRQPVDLDHDVQVRNQTAVTVGTKRMGFGAWDGRGWHKVAGA